jgi:hypothetical protein
MQQPAAKKNNGYFKIDFSQIMERKDSPIISRQRASFVLSKLGYVIDKGLLHSTQFVLG